MSLLMWIIRILFFVVFFGFAWINTERVTLDYFLGQWTQPLVLFLLIFFAAGALFGILVLLPALFRYQKQIKQLRRDALQASAAPVNEPPRFG